ncbi:MAG TPA: DUF4340 domain-containing protein [Acetobacteraceae bacterium]|nr:DUF4340 domain-containing protein [Acetobacteraceae bacterium]
MKPRSTLILVVVAVLVLGAGWYFGPHQNPAEQEQESAGTLLFPGLDTALAKAERIEIMHAGKHFAIVRKGDVWTLPSLSFYPVIATKLHAMLAGLTELRVEGRRTADPAQFATIGVDDPGRPGATGTLVSVSDGAGHVIASLITGHQNYAASGEGTETLYVRRPGQDQSWLAQGQLNIDADPDLWIDHDLTNIDHGKVTGIAVTRGTQTLTFATKDGKLALTAPAQHKPLESDKLDDVWRALEDLSFSSVRAGPALSGKILAHTIFTLAGGATVDVTLAKEGGKLWARFTASGTGAEAKTLAGKFGDWSYQLGEWRESALAPTLDDLLATPPPGKT